MLRIVGYEVSDCASLIQPTKPTLRSPPSRALLKTLALKDASSPSKGIAGVEAFAQAAGNVTSSKDFVMNPEAEGNCAMQSS
jgi:hypothetical protein